MSKLKLPPWPICQKGGTLYSGARYVALWASCLCIYLGEGRGGVALMHVYVLEHKVSHYRTAWQIFMKLGRDEVLMAPHMHEGVLARSTQGRIQGRAKIGDGGASSRKCFFRLEGYSNKPNVQQWSRSMWDEVLLFFVPFWSQFFYAFIVLQWATVAFWASCLLIVFIVHLQVIFTSWSWRYAL